MIPETLQLKHLQYTVYIFIYFSTDLQETALTWPGLQSAFMLITCHM